MKKICFTVFAFTAVLSSFAQNKIYDASSIPAELKKNAHSVIREEKLSFDVKSVNRATYKVHKVVTVLNENGKDELDFHEFTDKFISLESVSLQLFDSKGSIIKKYKRSDLSVQTAGEGLVPDGKVYFLQLPSPQYPVTIQIDYELDFDGLLNYPRYQVQLPEQSIEISEYTATVPADLDLRFKGKNTNILPVTVSDEKIKTYTWAVKNLPALEHEAGSLSYGSRYPHILLSPNKFELDSYSGDMTSWQNFGNWYKSLAKDANNLTAERKQFFQSLTNAGKNEQEKIRILYNYLQSNCRYVLISLGIGGFKPFEADFVDKKKYGDCKALSNYMQACLDAIGIKSYQALINSDYNKEPVDPAFPYNGFNHVIVCVPLPKDTVWLECTSNTTECGTLGNFTENKYALLITEDGGKLVPTPTSKASDNLFSSTATIELGADGSGLVNVSITATGEYKQDLVHYISNQKKDDQKRFLVNYLGYNQPDEFEINYDQVNKNAATKMEMLISKIPEFSAGKKVFLNPRLYKIWGSELPKTENRTQDFYFEHPFIKTDTTTYKLPEGFTIETLPKAKNIVFEYGSFNSSYKFIEDSRSIISISRLQLNQYKIPVAKFVITKNFFNEVLGEYTEKIVIKKL